MAQHPLRTRARLVLVSLASVVSSISCAHTPSSTPSTVAASRPPRPSPTPLPAPPSPRAGPFTPRAAFTTAQRKWIDSTLASLPLRERVGQMVMVWVLGDYTSY